ncbi:MAG TPA: inner-membrane translocator [Ktedonobacterales bacterium]
MSSDLTKVTADVSTPAPPAAPEETPIQAMMTRLRRGEVGQLPAILMLIVIVAIFAYISGGVFLYPRNLSNLILQEASTAVVAMGAVLVLLLAEIDLSLAAVANLCGAVMVTLSTYQHFPAWLALLSGLLVGTVVGLINGFFVAVVRIPSFVVTLAAYIFYSGLLLHILLPNTTIRLFDKALVGIMSNYLIFPWDVLSPIPIILVFAGALYYERARRARLGLKVSPAWTPWLTIGVVILLTAGALAIFESAFGVPYSMYILLGLLLVLWLVLRFTTYGRHLYAVGGNPEAARRAGISVTAIRISVFALASTLAALGGILTSSRTISGDASVDPTLLLLAIAVAVIGGVSLFGGRGSIWGVALGILIIGSLENGLTLFTATGTDLKQMLEGAVLIAAVVLDALTRRRNAVSGR